MLLPICDCKVGIIVGIMVLYVLRSAMSKPQEGYRIDSTATFCPLFVIGRTLFSYSTLHYSTQPYIKNDFACDGKMVFY